MIDFLLTRHTAISFPRFQSRPFLTDAFRDHEWKIGGVIFRACALQSSAQLAERENEVVSEAFATIRKGHLHQGGKGG